MKRFVCSMLAFSCYAVLCATAQADEKDASAVLDKAIKALGGQDNLKKAAMATWKGKGKITLGDNENQFSTQTTVQGIDHYRGEFEGEFNGNQVKGVTVLNGDKGWRKFGDMSMELDDAALANEKRTVYLQVIPITLLPLKGPAFKIETAGQEKVGDATATVLKVTAPDGKDFKLYFDQESGVPVKLVATVLGFMGEEFTQETTYGNYKDFDGVKKATKVESKRDGQRFVEQEISEFKVLDKIEPGTFDEPK